MNRIVQKAEQEDSYSGPENCKAYTKREKQSAKKPASGGGWMNWI
jgi:hypothetical protein